MGGLPIIIRGIFLGPLLEGDLLSGVPSSSETPNRQCSPSDLRPHHVRYELRRLHRQRVSRDEDEQA